MEGLIEGFLSKINPKGTTETIAFIVLIGFLIHNLRLSYMAKIDAKKTENKGISDEILSECDERFVGKSTYTEHATHSFDLEKRLIKVEKEHEKQVEINQKVRIREVETSKDIETLKRDFETMSVKIEGTLSQHNEVLHNQAKEFKELVLAINEEKVRDGRSNSRSTRNRS